MKTIDRTARMINMANGIAWAGVLAFLTRWFLAYQAGRLGPGTGTPWLTLVILFIALLALSLSGLWFVVHSWRKPIRLRWRMASLVVSLISLWAVVGG